MLHGIKYIFILYFFTLFSCKNEKVNHQMTLPSSIVGSLFCKAQAGLKGFPNLSRPYMHPLDTLAPASSIL